MADKKIKIIMEAVDNASAVIDNVGDNVNKVGINLKKMAVVSGTAMTAVGVATVALGKNVLKEAGKFEQYELALSSMIGEAEVAGKLYENLVEFAKETPFGFEDVIQGTKQLVAMGSTAENVIPELKMLGDVSSALNVPMSRLILNFGQVRTAGKLAGRELRDFNVAGVPLMEELAKNMGKTKEEIQEMVSDGLIGFDDVKEAFRTMTSEGGKFNDMMAKQSGTLLGKTEKLSDSFQQLKVSLGKALIPAVQDLVELVTPLVDRFTEFAEKNPELVATVFKVGIALGGLGAVILLVAGNLAILSAGAGALGISIATLLGWVVLVPIALGAIVGAGIYLYKHWEQIKTKASEIWKNISESISKFTKNTINSIKDGWNKASEWLENTWDTVSENIVNFVKNTWNEVSEWLGNIWDEISKTRFFKFAQSLYNLAKNFLGMIKEVFLLAFELIAFGVGGSMTIIGGIVNATMSDITESIETKMQMNKAIITGDLILIRSAWESDFLYMQTITNWIMEDIKKSINNSLTRAKILVGIIVEDIRKSIQHKFNMARLTVAWVVEDIRKTIQNKLDKARLLVAWVVEDVKRSFDAWITKGEGVIKMLNGIVTAVRDAVRAARDFVGGAMSKIPGVGTFQHGGVVPGAYNQAVPIVAHGGERIIPKTGTDVNTGGGGGFTLNLTIEGDVHSMDTVDRIAETVENIISRNQELAQQGVSV